MTEADINKLMELGAAGQDPAQQMRAAEIDQWSEARVREAATKDDLPLTDEHFAVIRFLQNLYIQRGRAPHARLVSTMLNKEFDSKGGSQYLYRLFPGGPVAQGSRLAGVPAPHDTQDRSFGSTY